jgi:hypothetical protein
VSTLIPIGAGVLLACIYGPSVLGAILSPQRTASPVNILAAAVGMTCLVCGLLARFT